MHDHFDAFASHPGTSRPLFSRQEFWRHDNELLSRVATHWYLEAPQTLAEWDALQNGPDLLDENGRSRAERLKLITELSTRITGILRDQIPSINPQPLRDFANPPPGLSQAQRGHLLQDAHDLVREAKIVTILRSRRADALERAPDRALDRPEDPAEGTVPPAVTTEAKAPGTAGAPISQLLAVTVGLLGRATWQIEIVRFLAGRMSQRIALRAVAHELYNSKEPTRARVDTVRRQCERTRKALDLKGCPLRMVIHENSVWLEEHR
jgi:hypothetical protein